MPFVFQSQDAIMHVIKSAYPTRPQWNLLPEDWSMTRKKNKIANLLSEMKREGSILNKGKANSSCWVRNV